MAGPGSKLFGATRDLTRVVLFGLACLALAPERSAAAEKPPVLTEEKIPFDPNALKPWQSISLGPPPLSPAEFNPDSGVPQGRPAFLEEAGMTLKLTRTLSQGTVQSPKVFNPDPGATFRKPPAKVEPFFQNEFGLLPPVKEEEFPPELQLPRGPLRSNQLTPVEPPPAAPRYGSEPLPDNLKLPRPNARANEPIPTQFRPQDYPLSRAGEGVPPNTEPVPDRWRVKFVPWRRYTTGEGDSPYLTASTGLWRPYEQSILKGDAPVIGQDIFLNLAAGSQTELEFRRLPTPSGVSSAHAGGAEFFGRSEQFTLQQNFSFTADLFQGETVFKPVEWAVRVQPVVNVNYTQVRETGVLSPDPRSIDRTKYFFGVQEAFGELHLRDLSVNYDFIAARAGLQTFNSDFRGFIFNNTDLGVRLFGNALNNQWQYNFAIFDLREKDTYSDLNTLDSRNQRVIVLNAYRQDFIWPGYTAQLSFHANLDEGGRHYDRNGNLTRPEPIGDVRDHAVRAYYFGWAGDGHIGRLNINHAFYQAVGRDEFNGIAGRPVDINAQMGALELSYDRDWIRYKASFFYASGDGHAEDGTGTGFDTIIDNPNFSGGPFSYWTRQGFNLAGTAIGLKQRNSLVPNLRSSKTEGQANFVNPGVFIYGLGADFDVTPKLRGFLNLNYVRLAETDSLQTALLTGKIRNEMGLDCSLGFQFRPLLNENIIISSGFGVLLPGSGFRDIYRTSTVSVPGFPPPRSAGSVDDFLYSAVMAVTFTY